MLAKEKKIHGGNCAQQRATVNPKKSNKRNDVAGSNQSPKSVVHSIKTNAERLLARGRQGGGVADFRRKGTFDSRKGEALERDMQDSLHPTFIVIL